MRRSLSKKGVSPIIGYILLISFVIIISIIVYQWVKTYVPREALECPDGVSIFVKEKEIDCEAPGPYEYLNLTFKNNGRFNISGYFIRYSNNPEILATNSLWEKIEGGIGMAEGWVSFGDPEKKDNSLGPGEEEQDNFTFSLTNKISFVEIIPVRYEEIDNRLRLSSCSDAKITEVICSGDLNCVPECDLPYNCGKLDGCGGTCPDVDGTCSDAGKSCSGGSCSVICGDELIGGSEQCDGSNLGTPGTCEGLDYGPGTLSCSSCNFDTSMCTAPDLTLSITNPVSFGNGANSNQLTIEIAILNNNGVGNYKADNVYANATTGDPTSVDEYPQKGPYNLVDGGTEPAITFSWKYNTPGIYTPIIKVDADNKIPEKDEGNNEISLGTIDCQNLDNCFVA